MFHGADDWLTPPEFTRRMARAIRDAGGEVYYAEYPRTGHHAWERTYDNPNVIAWMLAQRRS